MSGFFNPSFLLITLLAAFVAVLCWVFVRWRPFSKWMMGVRVVIIIGLIMFLCALVYVDIDAFSGPRSAPIPKEDLPEVYAHLICDAIAYTYSSTGTLPPIDHTLPAKLSGLGIEQIPTNAVGEFFDNFGKRLIIKYIQPFKANVPIEVSNFVSRGRYDWRMVNYLQPMDGTPLTEIQVLDSQGNELAHIVVPKPPDSAQSGASKK